ncbi:MAG: hypothetical protein AB7G13_09835 [Lautropia sp.]
MANENGDRVEAIGLLLQGRQLLATSPPETDAPAADWHRAEPWTPQPWLDAAVSRYGIRRGGTVARIGIGRHRTFRAPDSTTVGLLVL